MIGLNVVVKKLAVKLFVVGKLVVYVKLLFQTFFAKTFVVVVNYRVDIF